MKGATTSYFKGCRYRDGWKIQVITVIKVLRWLRQRNQHFLHRMSNLPGNFSTQKKISGFPSISDIENHE